MEFHHRVPRAPLDGVIEFVWLFRQDAVPFALERVLPTGAPQLIVNLVEDRTRRYVRRGRSLVGESAAGTIVAGSLAEFDVIDTAEQTLVAGVAFKPGGLVPFISLPPSELVGLDVSVEDLWGPTAVAVLRERLLEARDPNRRLDVLEAVLRERWTNRAMHPAVSSAIEMFHARPHLASVAAVTQAVGLSAKRFIEHFKSDIGLTPKRYCRVQRFRRAVRRANRGRSVDWMRVALDAGYYDQAHFIHDFREFSGLTPTDYVGVRTPFENHVKFLQAPERTF